MATRALSRAAALAALALGGCVTAPHSHYAWGGYEESIYIAQAKPGSVPPEQQVIDLEADREAARAANQPMPPGWHVHLGYLYYQTGRLDAARAELAAEKQAFPESTAFVDRLLANLAGKPKP